MKILKSGCLAGMSRASDFYKCSMGSICNSFMLLKGSWKLVWVSEGSNVSMYDEL